MCALKLKNQPPPPIPDYNQSLGDECKNIKNEKDNTPHNDLQDETTYQDDAAVSTKKSPPQPAQPPLKKLSKQSPYYVGIDIGSVGLKTVILQEDTSGNLTPIIEDQYFVAEEGITDEAELYQAVSSHVNMLLEGKPHCHICLGVPQFFGSILTKDFPPNLSPKVTADLVLAETTQLSHLSENHFFYDWQQMTPNSYMKNPIFIAVSREEVVRDYYKTFINSGLPVDDLSFSGLSDVNTLLSLHPEIKNDAGIHLLMDIGADNTIIAIIGNGNLLAINALSYGSSLLTQTIKQQFGLSDNAAEQAKISGKYVLDNRYENSFIREKSRHFASDLTAIVNEWRESMEFTEGFSAETDGNLNHLWLCGGGCLLEGLTNFLEGIIKVPTSILCPPSEQGGKASPIFSNAYGLALHASGKSQYHISFLPPEIKQGNTRQKEARWLIGGLAAVAIVGFGLMAASTSFTYQDLKVFRTEYDRISQINGRISAINRQQKEIEKRDLQALPMIAYGNISYRLQTTWQLFDGQNKQQKPYVDGTKTWPIFWKISVPAAITKNENTTTSSEVEAEIGIFKKIDKKDSNNKVTQLRQHLGRGLLSSTKRGAALDEDPKENHLSRYLSVATLKNEIPLYCMLAVDNSSQLEEYSLVACFTKEDQLSNKTDRINRQEQDLFFLRDSYEKQWQKKQYANPKKRISIYPLSFIFKDSLFNIPAPVMDPKQKEKY